jgi:hypothetical protein
MNITKALVSFTVCVVILIVYFKVFPKDACRLQLVPVAARDLNGQEKISKNSFFIELRLEKADHHYTSPEGKYTKNPVNAHDDLTAANTTAAKTPLATPDKVLVPIGIKIPLASTLKPGDEILLSVNGRIYPSPANRTFSLKIKETSVHNDQALVVVEIPSQYLTDSLWMVKAEDHIVPIILDSIK